MTLRLNGDSSGFTEIKAADAAGDNSIKLPSSNGSANQLLQNGGTAGELQYTSAGGGLHCDSSGRLLVGTSSYSSTRPPAAIYLDSVSTTPGFGNITLGYNGTSPGNQNVLNFYRTRGTTSGAVNSVAANDSLGAINFSGADGIDALSQAASIACEVDGTPSTDVMPGKITFSTNAGGASVTPRVEIGSNGALKLLAGCPGIDFSGIQTNAAGVTSETLDSYEEGTFQPNLVLLTGSTIHQTIAPQSSSFKGRYTKIGNRVWVNLYARYDLSTITAASWSQALITLPFTHGSFSGQQYATGSIGYLAQFLALPTSGDSNHYFPGLYVGSGTNYIFPTINQINGAEVYLTQTHLTRNSSAGIMAMANYSVETF